MPTISEDGSTDRESQESGDDANFEQLMVNMLDERDKLMEALRESQDLQSQTQSKLQESEKEKETLQRQLASTQPQVNITACIVSSPPTHIYERWGNHWRPFSLHKLSLLPSCSYFVHVFLSLLFLQTIMWLIGVTSFEIWFCFSLGYWE